MIGTRPLRTITRDEVEAFERDGFVVLPGVLSPAWLLPLVAACERLLAAPEMLDITEETLHRGIATSPDQLFGARPYAVTLAERGHFRMNFNTARRDAGVLGFALRGAVGGIAAAVMQSPVARFVDDILFVKEPRTEEPTEWHDDDGGSITSGEQRCSVWVSLADVSLEAGAMRFLRRSHRRFAGWRERGETAESIVTAHPGDVVACPLAVGDVAVHHLATIHGAGPNATAEVRRAWALRFAGEQARFLLRPVRREARDWYGLEDGQPLAGPRFPVAWPGVEPAGGAGAEAQ